MLVVLAVVAAAFLVSRGCQRSAVRVTEDQALGIAQRHIDFRPDGHTIRLVPRGVPPRRYWAVSYWRHKPAGGRRYTVLLVDANTGKVRIIRRQ